MEFLKDLAAYAGPVALAAFAGTFLGGVVLSFFWKNFGPWKLLEACKAECAKCQKEREEDQLERLKDQAKISDVNARYETLRQAMVDAGFGLHIAVVTKTTTTTSTPVVVAEPTTPPTPTTNKDT